MFIVALLKIVNINRKYPFDASLRSHIMIAIGLAIWIFLFLYFTEPLDVNEFSDSEKLIYLPLYGLIGSISYLIFIPFQSFLYFKSDKIWSLKNELIFLFAFIVLGTLASRLFYLYVIVANEPNPYSLSYHITSILFPVYSIVLPIIILGRFGFGKYRNKKAEAKKVEIKGEGNYEGLRLFFNDIICIQSADNYIEVVYLNGKDIKKTLIRNKLSTIADEFPELLRTHRSYLINPHHFLQWKTENSKLFVELFHHIIVPVSRTYQKEVKNVLQSTTE